MQGYDGSLINSFMDLESVGFDHFKGIFKEDNRVSIVEVVRVVIYFPSFVSEDDNASLVEVFSKDELQVVIHCFQKDKNLRPNEWPIDFFSRFL